MIRHRSTAASAALVLLLTAMVSVQAEPLASPATIEVPGGPFIMGSTPEERETAYRLDERAYGHSITREREWYDGERRRTVELATFHIMRTPVTNAQYKRFIEATGHRSPQVNPNEWRSYRLIHPFRRALGYMWRQRTPARGREDHPVVLVAHSDAVAYANWLSKSTGQKWRLPSEAEWEKAARGTDGRLFPWGNKFDADKLNSHDKGPYSTIKVGLFKDGASPYGMLDAAGQVFEWTSDSADANGYIVKGGSWDDKGCGVCRPAARHARPQDIKHILVGFRLIRE